LRSSMSSAEWCSISPTPTLSWSAFTSS